MKRVRFIAGLAEINKAPYFMGFSHFGATGRHGGVLHFFSPPQYAHFPEWEKASRLTGTRLVIDYPLNTVRFFLSMIVRIPVAGMGGSLWLCATVLRCRACRVPLQEFSTGVTVWSFWFDRRDVL
ncbi:MAG: hypothetical protein FWC50_05365 [Planctomycetaceae bacterium]|nr:hypothetical protein [Planctomycetaceae bacterium]